MTQWGTGWPWKRPRPQWGRGGCKAFQWRTVTKRTTLTRSKVLKTIRMSNLSRGWAAYCLGIQTAFPWAPWLFDVSVFHSCNGSTVLSDLLYTRKTTFVSINTCDTHGCPVNAVHLETISGGSSSCYSSELKLKCEQITVVSRIPQKGQKCDRSVRRGQMCPWAPCMQSRLIIRMIKSGSMLHLHDVVPSCCASYIIYSPCMVAFLLLVVEGT